MKRFHLAAPLIVVCLSWWNIALAASEESPAASESTQETDNNNPIFDDKHLLNGYAQKFRSQPLDIIVEMIKDDALTSYKTAAAVRVFREQYSEQVFSKEKILIEKHLLRRLNLTDSSFVEVEIMHTLCLMDRYKFFNPMVPLLIQKLDHYNTAVNELAYKGLEEILYKNTNRAYEARLVFNTLRKILFLSRKRLANIKEPDAKLKEKLDVLRWSIKILGTEELKRLPSEVIKLL